MARQPTGGGLILIKPKTHNQKRFFDAYDRGDEIILYNESGENITSHVYSNEYEDYLRIKDTAYNIAQAFMEEDYGD